MFSGSSLSYIQLMKCKFRLYIFFILFWGGYARSDAVWGVWYARSQVADRQTDRQTDRPTDRQAVFSRPPNFLLFRSVKWVQSCRMREGEEPHKRPLSVSFNPELCLSLNEVNTARLMAVWMRPQLQTTAHGRKRRAVTPATLSATEGPSSAWRTACTSSTPRSPLQCTPTTLITITNLSFW